jgi:uncharacterized membrane protein YkvA (DUF1232 family)
MAEKKSTDITISPNNGMIHNLVLRTKLILRLLGDPRVSAWAKFIPIGSLIYVVSPIDLIMGVPGLDALDDAAVIGLGYYFFIEMCPPDVVQEHLKALAAADQKSAKDDVVEGEATDVESTEIKKKE